MQRPAEGQEGACPVARGIWLAVCAWACAVGGAAAQNATATGVGNATDTPAPDDGDDELPVWLAAVVVGALVCAVLLTCCLSRSDKTAKKKAHEKEAEADAVERDIKAAMLSGQRGSDALPLTAHQHHLQDPSAQQQQLPNGSQVSAHRSGPPGPVGTQPQSRKHIHASYLQHPERLPCEEIVPGLVREYGSPSPPRRSGGGGSDRASTQQHDVSDVGRDPYAEAEARDNPVPPHDLSTQGYGGFRPRVAQGSYPSARSEAPKSALPKLPPTIGYAYTSSNAYDASPHDRDAARYSALTAKPQEWARAKERGAGGSTVGLGFGRGVVPPLLNGPSHFGQIKA